MSEKFLFNDAGDCPCFLEILDSDTLLIGGTKENIDAGSPVAINHKLAGMIARRLEAWRQTGSMEITAEEGPWT